MKRYSRLLIIMIAMAVLAGCSSEMLSPEDQTIAYLENIRDGKLEAAYNSLSSGSVKIKTFEQFEQENANQLYRYFKDIITFELIDVSANDSSAMVGIKRTYPDLSGFLPDMMGRPLAEYVQDADAAKELYEKLSKKQQGEPFPTASVDQTFYLNKESSGWKIRLDK